MEAILLAQTVTHVAGFTIELDSQMSLGHGLADLYEVRWSLSAPTGRFPPNGVRFFKRPLRAAHWFAWFRRQAGVGFDTTFPALLEDVAV